MKGRQMSKAKLLRWAAPVALMATLGACVSIGGGKAPAQLYTLTSDAKAPQGTQAAFKPADTLVVAEPDTDRSLATARMTVQVNPTAIAYMKDAYWVERPARLLRNLLAEDLRATGKRPVTLDEDGVGATRLDGRLLAMGYDAHAHAAVIRYDAVLHHANGEVTMHRFEVSEPDVSPNGGDLAQALNRAANTLAGQVAEWIG
jgi:cholesterol transport system auxiliary component